MRGNAVRQANSPTPLALVHAKYDATLRGRVVDRSVEQQKAWSQLSHRNGTSVKEESNSNVCGVTAVTAGLEINE
jgi:hypothetical protein